MEIYEIKAICKELQIVDSTLRKYAAIFEKGGYTFAKDVYGNRVYNEKDLQTFKRFINEKKKNSKIDNQTIALRFFDKRYQQSENEIEGIEFPFYYFDRMNKYFEKQNEDQKQILHQLQNSVSDLTKKIVEIEKNQVEQSALLQIILAEKREGIIDKLKRKK
ncbi:MAG: hypothetical protein ABS938_00920 [Psychrobacillus psychrodurans]